MRKALQISLILYLLILPFNKLCLATEQKMYTPTAIISIQKGETEKTAPFSLNLDGRNSTDPQNLELEFKWIYPNNKIITSKNPRSYKFKNPGKYKISLTVTNPLGFSDSTEIEINALGEKHGDLSTEIYFNEIFPNPKGKDKNNEWIELFNNSNKDINLKNWKILNQKSSHTISNKTIKANSYLSVSNLKITLKNKEEHLKLLDFNNNLIDEIKYKNASEGLSYNKKQNWTTPSKNYKNNEIITLEGEILGIGENKNLKIKTLNKTTSIKYHEEINKNLIKLILKPKNTVKIQAEKNKTGLVLQKLEILPSSKLKTTETKEEWILKTTLLSEILIPFLIYSYNKSLSPIAV